MDRAAVLVPPPHHAKFDPRPISPEAFHKLLAAANELERAALLLSLNACLYLSELLDVDWSELHLNAHEPYYLTNRNKTGMIRAAVLWPRTIDALRKLRRTPGKVFRSRTGARARAR